jgi:catechol 2,3-dioxygenase-like lactoylglutathione lyase family enzyme
MTIALDRIDHIVLTVRDIDQTIEFYCNVFGMTEVTFGDNRKTLKFGKQKINLHPQPSDITPKANQPTPGAMDICFITQSPIDSIVDSLQKHDINIELGPVQRQGAQGNITSVYIRDPDDNLIEIAHYNN